MISFQREGVGFMANTAKSHTRLENSISLPPSQERVFLPRRLSFPIFYFLLCLVTFACSSQGQATTLISTPTAAPESILPTQPNETTLPAPFESTPSSAALAPTEPLPPTLEPTPLPLQSTALPTVVSNREFDSFVQTVMNGNSNEIVGVYVENVLALRVVQQPANDPAWVSSNDGEATEFLLAFVYAGNIGLLAHNYLAGRYFFSLKAGDLVQLIYGDGSVLDYEINEIREYQALQPRSVDSDFVDLQTGEMLTATNLFYAVYGGDHHLTFQTCIDRDNDSEWGRLFPIAFPVQ
jgi:hypothetical protein